MFERRLKVLLILPVIFGGIIIGRLYQLQVVHGEQFADSAEAALISPKQFLPPLRGRILDRFGRVLVSDEPAHDVTVHYGVLSMDEAYLDRLASRMRHYEPQWRTTSNAELTAEVRRRIRETWTTLSEAGGEPLRTLRRRRDAICATVERLRRHIHRARQANGFDEPIEKLRLKEESLYHAILRDVTPETRTRIELALAGRPFVRIEPSVRRVWADDADTLSHVLGRLGQVSAEAVRSDPLRDDWLACYRAGDQMGVSGAERLGERMLRGKRGFEERLLDGSLNDRASPFDGLDVQLTLDLDLQRRVADILGAAVAEHPDSTGGSCVVIDVESREILALVSLPTYTRHGLAEDFASLRDDAARIPLLFRAVQAEYQPGSILKPVALLAGFANNLVNPMETTFCSGHFIEGSDKWHCWTHWRHMPGHGNMNAEDAIKNSCNVYFYSLGQRIGAKRLTDFYRTFVRGESGEGEAQQSTELIEERLGLIPTLAWMREHRKRSFRPADGRNYAIGQGEILLTPLQAANMFATLAEGHYRVPTLIANDGRLRPAIGFDGISQAAWDLVRRGVYRCVNEQGGTAQKYAQLETLEVCGKTGSAQCVPRIVERRYTFEIGEPGGAGEGGETPRRSVVAPTVEAAREMLDLPRDAKCVEKKPVRKFPLPDPKDGKVPTHAWFAGFAPYHHPTIALAVVVEYGGSGGRTAGPVGKAVFEALMESPRGYLGSSGGSPASEAARR
ncbi:MAG: penicillin-binding transpeptidase domain-containing protein [Planctomycetota bacterium]